MSLSGKHERHTKTSLPGSLGPLRIPPQARWDHSLGHQVSSWDGTERVYTYMYTYVTEGVTKVIIEGDH